MTCSVMVHSYVICFRSHVSSLNIENSSDLMLTESAQGKLLIEFTAAITISLPS